MPGSLLPGSTSLAENAGLGAPEDSYLLLPDRARVSVVSRTERGVGKGAAGMPEETRRWEVKPAGKQVSRLPVFTLHGEVG